MKLSDLFVRAFVGGAGRKLAFVLVVLALSWVGVGKADAQTRTINQAYDAAQAVLANWTNSSCPVGYGGYIKNPVIRHEAANMRFMVEADCMRMTGSPATETLMSHFGPWQETYNAGSCTAPAEWDGASESCVNNRDRCLAKNADRATNSAAIFTGMKCIDRCEYGSKGSGGSSSSGGFVIQYGELGYTGNSCSTGPDPEPPDDPEACNTPTGQTLTLCVKKNGDHCYAASTGRQICWTPGETGTKTDGNVAQKRTPGTNPQTPPSPPPGDTLNDTNKPTTTTTTTTNGTTINNTTNNYTTGSGSDAGGENQGEPPGSDDGDEGDGEDGTASGGAGCEDPPVCGGGDQVGCATLLQIWRVRCSDDKNKITGAGGCDENGNPLVVCAGDPVQCKQTLLIAEERCKANRADANGDGRPDWTQPGPGDGTEGGGEEPGEDVGKVVEASFGAPMLDDTGFSWSRSCPQIGSVSFGPFGTFDLDAQPWMCDFTALVRSMFYLIGSFIALCIVLGWRSGG